MKVERPVTLQFHPGVFPTVAIVAVVHRPHAGIGMDLEARFASRLNEHPIEICAMRVEQR